MLLIKKQIGKDTSDIWVAGYFSVGWAFENLPVKAVDQKARRVYLNSSAHYGVNSANDLSTPILKVAQNIRGFYFYNILEELDEPGEWYLDRKAKILYVWPKSSIDKDSMEISLLSMPMFKISNVAGISFSDLNFRCVRDKFIDADDNKNINIKNCKFINSGTEGIVFNKSSNISIENCVFKNTGTSSIILTGGNRKTLQSGNNVILNCDISGYSRVSKSGTPGISLDGVGAVVDHCYLHNAPNQAIIYRGNDHVIRNNYISEVCKDYYDMGAVYTGRDPASTGTVIENNIFNHIISTRGSVAAVYMDDGSGGISVRNNLFIDCGGTSTLGLGAVHVHGGGDNHMDNNVFVNCKKAFSDTPWSDKKWIDTYFRNPLYKNQLVKIVDIRSDLYQKRYPQLRGFFQEDSLRKRINYINNTICYNVQTLNSGRNYKESNTLMTRTNPLSGDLKIGKIEMLEIPAEAKRWKGWSEVDIKKICKPNN